MYRKRSEVALRICLVSEEFPPETGWGGIGTHTYNLALALAGTGHSVDVVTKSVDGKRHLTEMENLRVHRIPESAGDSGFLKKIEQAAPKLQKNRIFSGFADIRSEA